MFDVLEQRGREIDESSYLAAPAGTPDPIVRRLNDEVHRIANCDEAHRSFSSLGGEPGIVTPEEFAAAIRSEHAKWAELIRVRRIEVQ